MAELLLSPPPMRTTTSLMATVAAMALAGCSPQGLSEVTSASGSDDTVATDVMSALQAFPHAEVWSLSRQGTPTHVFGELGKTPTMEMPTEAAMLPALTKLAPVFRLNANDLSLRRTTTDELKRRHLRYQQTRAGLEVVGGDLVVHLNEFGEIYAVSGAAHDGQALPSEPAVTAQAASDKALADTTSSGGTGLSAQMPALTYLQSTEGTLHLTWSVVVSGEREADPLKERVFVDALSGEVIERHGLIHSALNRRVYTARNGSSTPGSLLRSEGQAATGDSVADTNYDLLGQTYQCYQQLFGRDSINGSGLTLVSTVHYSSRYDNAYWDGQQMVYGDGSGSVFSSLAKSLDVTVHELTHGVTQYESNLNYVNEPGALNEGLSDIFAAICQAKQAGAVSSSTWRLAEDVYTPSNSSDAMRYMDDPAKDGQSRDYYPTRYTGSQDSGGVHLNSGIANLAFKLLVTGGTHPRGKSSVQVAGIGIEKAGKIFYRAQTTYLTSASGFQSARSATAQAAQELYGAAEVAAVHAAWSAVGAPGAPAGGSTGGGTGGSTGGTDGGTGGGTSSGTVLRNGVAITGLSGTSASQKQFTVQVPSGARNLRIQIAGGSGDADLYVKYGAAPTTTNWDYRPFIDGNSESVAPTSATAGTWYVMVRGYSSYSGLSLVASWQ